MYVCPLFLYSQHQPIVVVRLVRYSHWFASFLFSSLCLYVLLSVCSPFLRISGLGSLTIFYPWATRPLALAWSLTSATKPRPQVRCAFLIFSERSFDETVSVLFVCMHVRLCSALPKYAVLQRVRLYLLGLIFYVLNSVDLCITIN